MTASDPLCFAGIGEKIPHTPFHPIFFGMKLLSVNIARPEKLPTGRPEANDPPDTGIYKHPVSQPVRIEKEGLPGDYIGNLKYHGGADQAVYLYGMNDYAWWSASLERPLEPGAFGENLTFDELDNASVAIGDRFHIGEIILEVTAPRMPCSTLARRMGDSTFVKKFRAADRPGPYCRVIRDGDAVVGTSIQFEPYAGERVGLLELYRAEFVHPTDAHTLQRHLESPLASRFRTAITERLRRLED